MQRNWAQKFEYTFFFGILTQKTKIEALEELKWQKNVFSRQLRTKINGTNALFTQKFDSPQAFHYRIFT